MNNGKETATLCNEVNRRLREVYAHGLKENLSNAADVGLSAAIGGTALRSDLVEDNDSTSRKFGEVESKE